MSFFLFIIFLSTLPLFVNLFLVLAGIPLWFACLNYTFRLRKKIGLLWIILLAPLGRQLIWVIIPGIYFYISTNKTTTFFQTSVSMNFKLMNITDLTGGIILMSLGNYILFFTLVLGIHVMRLKIRRSSIRGNWKLALTGLFFMSVWTYFTYSSYFYGIVLQKQELGWSITRSWGYLGFVLFLVLGISGTQEKIGKRKIIFWIGAAFFFSMIFMGIGQRMWLIWPWVIVGCMVLAFSLNEKRRKNWKRLIFISSAVLVISLFLFSAVEGIRRNYYSTGYMAPLGDWPEYSIIGLKNMKYISNSFFARLSTMLFVGELATNHAKIFPDFGWLGISGQVMNSLVSTHIINLSSVLGLSSESLMQGLTPGVWLARTLNQQGTMTFQHEVEFYLAGGFLGVIIGTFLLGIWCCVLLYLVIHFQRNGSIRLAIVLGHIFPVIFLAELFTHVITLLTWNFVVLFILLKILGLILVAKFRMKTKNSVTSFS